MSNVERSEPQSNLPQLYIDGYFTRRIDAGERPNYGYPSNHLPKTTDEKTTVVAGFVAARKSK